MTEQLKDIYINSSTEIAIYDTIQLNHEAFGQVFYLINTKKEKTLKLENGESVVFRPCNFAVTKPSNTSKGLSNFTLTLSAIEPEIIQNFWNYMDALSPEPIDFVYRSYLSNSDEVQSSLPGYRFYTVALDYDRITLTSSMPDIVNSPFPFDNYDPIRLKGLKYV